VLKKRFEVFFPGVLIAFRALTRQ